MLHTPLFENHHALGAKMAPFGGFAMPIQYQGIMAEHLATRSAVTLFDTCHMGEFSFSGQTATTDLEHLLSCPVASLKIGQCRYGFLCNPEGGVIDDQILYRRGENEFMMVVNAGTQGDDFNWIVSHLSTGTTASDRSAETGKIDVQGPHSARIISQVVQDSIAKLRYYTFMDSTALNTPVTVSRTGYTGELGFEIYCPVEIVSPLWNQLLGLGAAPAGLGARDTLRLEMGFPLYGHELNQLRNAAESGFTRALDPLKEFVGSDKVRDPAAAKQRLCGIRLNDRRAARDGALVFRPDGTRAGIVTSGSIAPSLGVAIALAYVATDSATAGTPVKLDSGRGMLDGMITTTPLYTEATGRRKLSDFL